MKLYKSQCQFKTSLIQAIMLLCIVAINVIDVVSAGLQHAILLTCNSPNKSFQLQQCTQK